MIQCFLDTETTGVEVGACVIELAAIMVENGEIIDTFHQYARPYRKINKAAFDAHGISEKFLADKPEEKVMLQSFMEWFIGTGDVEQILAYNAKFDIRIINDRIRMDYLMEDDFLDKNKVCDVAVLARKAISEGKIPKNGRKWNQEYIGKCLGVTYNAHSAIEDVKAMMQIYDKLIKL